MKLKNKRTGEIIDTLCEHDITKGICLGVDHHDGNPSIAYYNSLTELNEEWEDYEKPKEYWFIDIRYPKVEPKKDVALSNSMRKRLKEIGNYFETKEEAEKAVAKLKAFANLRKRGLKFNGWDEADRGMVGEFAIYCDALELDGIERELEIVFGREEL